MSYNRFINFFHVNLSDERFSIGTEKADVDGYIRTAMFSSFFSDAARTPLCTNGMYDAFLGEITATLELYKTDCKVKLSVYEASVSDEFTRDFLLVGFNKYLYLRLKKEFAHTLNRILVFVFFAVFGFLCIYLSTVLNLSAWGSVCLQNVGLALLWNFVGYFAFEFSGQLRDMRRLKQIRNIEYDFRQWE